MTLLQFLPSTIQKIDSSSHNILDESLLLYLETTPVKLKKLLVDRDYANKLENSHVEAVCVKCNNIENVSFEKTSTFPGAREILLIIVNDNKHIVTYSKLGSQIKRYPFEGKEIEFLLKFIASKFFQEIYHTEDHIPRDEVIRNAIVNNNVLVLKLLRIFGDILTKDEKSKELLLLAVHSCTNLRPLLGNSRGNFHRSSIIRWLLKTTYKNGNNLLKLAVIAGNEINVKFLMGYKYFNANKFCGRDKTSPIDLARQKGNAYMVQVLEQKDYESNSLTASIDEYNKKVDNLLKTLQVEYAVDMETFNKVKNKVLKV